MKNPWYNAPQRGAIGGQKLYTINSFFRPEKIRSFLLPKYHTISSLILYQYGIFQREKEKKRKKEKEKRKETRKKEAKKE